MQPPPDAIPFWYTASYTSTLTNGSTTTLSIRFAEGTIFECHSLFARTSLDLVSTFNYAPFLCKLTDNGTGQQLSDGYVLSDAMFGSYNHLDGLLPTPMQFSGKSTLQFDLQNISGSSFTYLYLSAKGLRWRGNL